jgi:anti-sigma regulatory factor (Ser/Thr protein kinase)
MPSVEVSFTALPAHVRTARLVAAAVARRAGVDEAVLDEVRLAVGEACSRAVDLHRQQCPEVPVRVRLTDDDGAFAVEVTDCGAAEPAAAPAAPSHRLDLTAVDDLDEERLPPGMGLAVVSGLVDDVDMVSTDNGLQLRMRWALDPSGRREG